MPIFNDVPPTAGFPLRFTELIGRIFAKEKQSLFEEDFRTYLGVPYSRICCSGTASLYYIAETIKKLTHKRTIIIPAFICPLVPFALHRAGFRVELCDIMSDNFNYDDKMLSRICSSREDIAAVLVDHLAGIPVEMDHVSLLAEKHRFFIIEDCAQSLGAEYKNKKIGTRGDFAFFSMAAGKGLTMYEGGVIVSRHSKYAEFLDETCTRFEKVNILTEVALIIELFGYTLFYHPRLFWFIFTLPQLFWTWRKDDVKAFREDFSCDFPLNSVSRFRKKIGHLQFSRLESEINLQREKFNYYRTQMPDTGVAVIGETGGDRATYPFVAIICNNADQRKRILSVCENSGLGVSVLYARALHKYEYLEGIVSRGSYPNAEYIASCTITVSTNRWMTAEKIEKLCAKLNLINMN
jgi:perosamine synthetase